MTRTNSLFGCLIPKSGSLRARRAAGGHRPAARRGPKLRLNPLEDRSVPAMVVDFTQGANGDASNSPPLGDVTWINGILNPNNSEYFEGVSTLQRVFFDSIPAAAGNAHNLKFSHQAAKSTAHAYDFLTSWNQALAATNVIAPGTLVDPNTDGPDANTLVEAVEPGSSSPANFTAATTALRAGANFIDVVIPDTMGTLLGDNIQSRISAYEGVFGNRTLRIWGDAPISAASMTFDGYSGSGPLADYTLNWTSASTRILIEFGAHLAQGQDFTLAGVGYGAGKGAGSISGGPYHVQLFQLDGASLGSQDNQIQANAVSAPPSFTIDKTGDTLSKVGDPANYTITIRNDGTLPLYPQSITDSLRGTIAASQFAEGGANNDVLDPGETWTFTYDLVVPAGAPDPLVNTVTAVFDTAAALNGIELAHTDSHSVNLFQPSITIDKAADDHLAAVGDTITYTFTITNTSSADSPALDLTSVADTLLGNLTALFPDTLAPGGSASRSVTRVVLAGDPDPLPNTVTVHSNPLGFPNDIAATDSDTVNLFQPSITIDKSGDALSKVGDPVNYTIVVRNTSSADSPNLVGTVSDPLLGLSEAVDLAPGQSVTFDRTYVVPAGAPDPLVNTASVTATPVGSVNAVSASDGHSTNLFQPSIAIDKSVDDHLATVGDTLYYSILVTNTSSADSPNLVGNVVDAQLGINQAIDLAPGQSTTIAKSHVVTAADADPLPNTATVTVSPVGFPNVLTNSDSELVNLFQPSITIDKTGDALSKVGDPVNYTIVIRNTSSADTPNLVGAVTDSLIGDILASAFAESGQNNDVLEPGETWTYNYNRTVLAGDPDPLINTATVTAQAAGESANSRVTDSDDHSVNLFQPSIHVVKSGDTLGKVTDPADYTITITNTSSADSPDLVNPVVTDTLLGNLLAANPFVTGITESVAPDGKLNVGETWVISARRVVQAGDPDPLPNTVAVQFNPDGFPNVISPDATSILSHSVNLFQPRLRVVVAGDTLGKVTDPADYTVTITNISSMDSPDLVNPVVTDTLLGNLLAANPFMISSNADGSLSPGETWTITARRVVQAGDPDPLVNTVSAAFTVAAVPAAGFDGGNVITPDAASDVTHSVNLIQPNFGINKEALDADGKVLVGDTVTYRVTITDTSSADTTGLMPVGIIDTKVGALSPSAFAESGPDNDILDPGETWTLQYQYLVTDADVPSLTNGVTATYQIVPAPGQGFDGTNRYTRDDEVTLTVDFPPRGSVLPTAVTCDDFVNAVINQTTTIGSLMGELADGFNMTVSGGKITNMSSPGIAFYFTTFTAPADVDSNSFAVTIKQTSSGGAAYILDLDDVAVYKISGTAPTAHCDTLLNNAPTSGTDNSLVVTLPDSMEGQALILRARVRPKNIIGQDDPGRSNLPADDLNGDGIGRDLRNDFATLLGATQVDNDPDGVILGRRGPGLEAAALPAQPVSAKAPTAKAVRSLFREAVRRWRLAGADVSALTGVTIQITDLGGTRLGETVDRVIRIDDNAAGWGWFRDRTARSDREFLRSGNQGERDRMDLLTVLMHEVGHLLGHDHAAGGLMSETLATGTRVTPSDLAMSAI